MREYPHRDAAMVYVYRLWPKIDRTQAGIDHSYIARWPLEKEDSVTERRLIDEFGSGTYHLHLTDKNRPKTLVRVASTKIDIDREDRPPVLNIEELVNCEQNASYIQYCKSQGVKLPWESEEVEDDTVQDPQGVAVRELASLTRQALERLESARSENPFQLALEAQKVFGGQRDNLDQVLKVVEVLNAARGESSKAMELMFSSLTKMLELQMQQAAREKPKSDLEQLKELLAIANELRGPGGGDSGWAALASSLPATLSGLAQVIGQVATMKAMASGAPAPAGPPVPVASAAGGQTNAAENPHQGEAMNVMKLVELGQKAVAAFERGEAGRDFADVVYGWDPQLYEFVAQNFSRAQLMGVLEQQPDIWQRVAPHRAEVEKFIDDFLAYGAEPDDGPETGVAA